MDGVTGLVGLEVADEVPAEVSGALGDFGACLLDAVFPEKPDAEAGDGPDGFRGVVFAHRHELNGSGVAAGAIAGVSDAALDLFEIPGKFHARSVATPATDRNRETRGKKIMGRQCWLVKQEPGDYAWAAFVKDGLTAWTGVRSYPARLNLRAMSVGDLVLYYHSGEGKEVVGVGKVVRAGYPDPTAEDGEWTSVDMSPVRAFKSPVALSVIKSDPLLRDMALVRQSRLSVMPVTPEQFERLLELGRCRL